MIMFCELRFDLAESLEDEVADLRGMSFFLLICFGASFDLGLLGASWCSFLSAFVSAFAWRRRRGWADSSSLLLLLLSLES